MEPIVVWAWRRLPELEDQTGQLWVEEDVARPLIEAGLLQEWSATDARDLIDIDLALPPPVEPPVEPPPEPPPELPLRPRPEDDGLIDNPPQYTP